MLDRCVTGTVLILAILLVRLIGGRWLPKRLICLLWIAASLYLLLPIRISSSFSVYGLLWRRFPAAAAQTRTLTTASAQNGQVRSMASGGLSLLWIYRIVRDLIGLWLGAAYGLGLIRMHRGKQDPHPYLAVWQVQNPSRRRIRILCSERCARPVSGGLLFPVILLPADRGKMTDRELECVLTHEYLHICHLDALWKLLYAVCLTLYWFHPAVWLLVFFANRDTEFACDEAVLETGVRSGIYNATLIRMELRRAEKPLLYNSFASGQLISRVSRIDRYHSGRLLTWVLGAGVAALVLALFATSPAHTEKGPTCPVGQSAPILQMSELEPPQTEVNERNLIVPDMSFETWKESAPSYIPDPYRTYQLLGEITGIRFDEINGAAAELKSTYRPHLLRITEDYHGNYSVRVYDFPED